MSVRKRIEQRVFVLNFLLMDYDNPVYNFVVALDFGTTFSGFAFCRPGDEIHLCHRYPFAPYDYCKTKSSVMYRRSKDGGIKL